MPVNPYDMIETVATEHGVVFRVTVEFTPAERDLLKRATDLTFRGEPHVRITDLVYASAIEMANRVLDPSSGYRKFIEIVRKQMTRSFWDADRSVWTSEEDESIDRGNYG